MSKDKPAFPQSVPSPDEFAHGMTLRDYFAAKAMQGFAAHLGPAHAFKTRAEIAYQWADAMMEARK